MRNAEENPLSENTAKGEKSTEALLSSTCRCFYREIRKLSNAVAEADEKISAKVTDLSDSVAQRLQSIAKEQTQMAETLTALHHHAAQQKDEIVAELRSQNER